jgi:hypothetical protein
MSTRFESFQTLDFGDLITRAQVEVESTLGDSTIGDSNEDDVRSDALVWRTSGRFENDLVVVVKRDAPTQHLGPEGGETRRIERVDADVLKLKSHSVTLLSCLKRRPQ